MQKFLHVGCGHNKKDRTTRVFSGNDWQEVRFDIDESVGPDLIGTILDMETVDTASVDAVYSSHNIEHVYPHEVPLALNEFYRVLKPSGYLVVTCPNLQAVCEFVSQDKLTEPKLFYSRISFKGSFNNGNAAPTLPTPTANTPKL